MRSGWSSQYPLYKCFLHSQHTAILVAVRWNIYKWLIACGCNSLSGTRRCIWRALHWRLSQDNIRYWSDSCTQLVSHFTEGLVPTSVAQLSLIVLTLLSCRCIDRWLGEHKWCCVCKADVEEMAKTVRQRPRHRNSREIHTYNVACTAGPIYLKWKFWRSVICCSNDWWIKPFEILTDGGKLMSRKLVSKAGYR